LPRLLGLLGTLEELLKPLLLRGRSGLAFPFCRRQGVLELMQRALLFLEATPELGIVFLDIEERLFHDGALGAQARDRLRFRHDGPRNWGGWDELPIDEPAEEPTSQQRHRGPTPGPRYQGLQKQGHCHGLLSNTT
jgi:hypothetical protein